MRSVITQTKTVNLPIIKEIITDQGFKVKNFKYDSGHVLSLSPHSLDRIKERCEEKSESMFEKAAVKVAHKFCEQKGVKGFFGIRSRIAVRSTKENVIVILSLDSMTSESEFTVDVVTVWNPDKGEFFFRRGMMIYDLDFSFEEGYEVKKAPKGTFTLQRKHWKQK